MVFPEKQSNVMSDKKFLILYGSVTGKAESIAQLIQQTSENQGFHSSLLSLADVEKFDLRNESCVVIVSSTTGDGEQPENVLPFLRSLSKENFPEDHLSHLQYTILGLGDTNYSQFCNGPKTLNKRLQALGAKTFYDPGWADDGLGLEIVVEPWIENLWEALEKCAFLKPEKTASSQPKIELKKFLRTRKMDPKEIENLLNQLTLTDADSSSGDQSSNLSSGDLSSISIPEGDLTVPPLPASYVQLQFDEEKTFESQDIDVSWKPKYPLSTSEVFECPIVSGRNLTKDGAHKTALEITIDLKDTGISCEPGDAISIICPNPKLEVDLLLKRLGVSHLSDCPTIINLSTGASKSSKIPEFFPPKFSLRHLFTNFLDIRSVPKKPLVRVLLESTTDPKEQKCLQFLCSRQGSTVYLEKIRGSNLCLLDLLLTFTSCNPPIERIIENLPRLMPRPYSTASYRLDDQVDFVFNVVEIPVGGGRKFPRRGLCTGWLEDHFKTLPGNVPKISLFSRQNKNFRLPENIETPLIMIGPGTGVAPFRGFLQKRRELLKDLDDKDKAGDAFLFFGCRNKKKDFLYESEMMDLMYDGALTKFYSCFSRDDPEAKIRYVQDSIREIQKDFVQMVFDKNAIIYVCGDAKNMSKDVNEAIVECTAKVLGLTVPEARGKVADLVIESKYLQDVWT